MSMKKPVLAQVLALCLCLSNAPFIYSDEAESNNIEDVEKESIENEILSEIDAIVQDCLDDYEDSISQQEENAKDFEQFVNETMNDYYALDTQKETEEKEIDDLNRQIQEIKEVTDKQNLEILTTADSIQSELEKSKNENNYDQSVHTLLNRAKEFVSKSEKILDLTSEFETSSDLKTYKSSLQTIQISKLDLSILSEPSVNDRNDNRQKINESLSTLADLINDDSFQNNLHALPELVEAKKQNETDKENLLELQNQFEEKINLEKSEYEKRTSANQALIDKMHLAYDNAKNIQANVKGKIYETVDADPLYSRYNELIETIQKKQNIDENAKMPTLKDPASVNFFLFFVITGVLGIVLGSYFLIKQFLS